MALRALRTTAPTTRTHRGHVQIALNAYEEYYLECGDDSIMIQYAETLAYRTRRTYLMPRLKAEVLEVIESNEMRDTSPISTIIELRERFESIGLLS